MDILNLFIHSSVNGHLCCFQCQAVTNKDAINIHLPLNVHELSFLLGKYLEVS
jgi:hypothetical protein